MTLLERVRLVLDAEGIAHALIGAAALAAHGVARSTFDIDLLATDARVLAAVVWEELRTAGVSVDVRRGDADDPLGGVVRLESEGQRPVDVIVGKGAWQTRVLERAVRPAGGPPVVTARDLVLLKLYAGGTQDVWDVRALLELPGADRLVAQVDEDLTTLPGDMLRRWTELRPR